MSLVYRKSTKSVARKYARSPGMEPNTGGVTHLTVINPGRPPRSNPFQWIRGTARGRHRHLSPAYRTMKGSRSWAQKHEAESKGAKLVAVDEFGTILTRPLSRSQVLRNTGRKTMAYNYAALKRAMRRNAKGRGPMPSSDELLRRASRRVSAAKMESAARVSLSTKPKRASKKTTTVKGGKVTAKAASKAAKSASKQASAAKKAASKAKKATSKKVASKAAKSAKKHASKAKKAAAKATSKAKKAKPSAKKAASKAAAKARAAARAAESAANAAAAASAKAQRRGRLSRKHGSFRSTSKAYGKFKRVKGWSASPFRTGRLFNPPYIHITSKHPKRRAAGYRMTANMLGRISQRHGLPVGQRVQLVEFGPKSRRKGYAVYVPGHVSERAYVRKFTFGGAARRAHQRAMQSGYSKKRYSKKSVSANSRRRTSMRRNSKRRHSRHSKRRHSRRLKGNRYVLVKNRRRRMRRNVTIFGVDPVSQVLIPGGYAVGGLMVANAVANAAGAMPALTNVLDAGRADPIVTKSIAGGLSALGMIAASGKLPGMLRDNLGPIVAGMGCAVAVRLLRGTQAGPYLGSWGAGFGEYVDQPLGAYVQDPSMGEYVDQPLGEYVDQPLGGLGTMYAAAGYPEGIDPADQGGVDGLMDVMEAAAGVGAFEAAAGMGTMYAAAGLGAGPGEAGSPIPVPTFTPPKGPGGMQQPPFVSIEQPIDMAKEVTAVMNRDLPIRTSLVTPEGRGSAGGIFSRSIFGGMMS